MAKGRVTITVAYPVALGDEEDFDTWSRLRLAESAERPGYVGGEVLAPARPGPDWLIVHRFEDERAARRWETWFANSPGAEPASSVTWTTDESPPAVDPPTQPGVAPARSRPARAPARPAPPPPPPPTSRRDRRQETRLDMRPDLREELRREPPPDLRREPPPDPRRDPPDVREPALPGSSVSAALVTLVAVFLAAALFDGVLLPYLQGMPALVRTAVLAVVVTAAVTMVTTPRARRRLRNWLVPIAIRERWELAEDPEPVTRRSRRRRAAPDRSRYRERY